MRSPFFRDLMTGLLVIVALAALTTTLWAIGDLKDVNVRFQKFTVRLDQSGGLTTSSGVTLNGVRIGKVDRLEPAPNVAEGVDVTVAVRDNIQIPRAFRVYLDRSLVGDAAMQLSLPPGLTPEQVADVVKPGELVTGKTAGTVFGELSEAIERPINALQSETGGLGELITSIKQASESLTQMLEPRTLADVQSGSKPPNISSAIARLDGTLVGANEWLGDDKLRGDVGRVVERAGAMVDRFERTLDNADRAVAAFTDATRDVRAQVGRVGENAERLSNSADESLRSLKDAASEIRGLTSEIRKGQGTLGQLATNPDLYNSLNDAAKRLGRALDKLDLLLTKYEKEGLPLKLN
ncbi:MAG: MlaD family protein [Planctomycetota bacterium]|nr:MlaD family protein [Planctomycetota bacterium]